MNFAFNLGNGEGRLVYNATRVDDGKWHRIKATRCCYTHTMIVEEFADEIKPR